MKKFSKIIASAVAAAVTISATTVFAGAVDYGSPPNYDEPTQVTEEDGTSADTPASIVTDDIIESAIENAGEGGSAIVYIDSEAVIREDAVGAIAKGDVPVTFEADDYSVTIDPASIEEVRSVDLSVEIEVLDSDTDMEGVSVPEGSVLVTPGQEGDFGMIVEITLDSSVVSGLDTDGLFLSYIDENGNVIILDDAVVVNEDGTVSIFVTESLGYIITDIDLTAAYDSEDEKETVDTDDSDDSDAEEVFEDSNPITGVTIFGTAVLAAVSAAMVTVTAKKRK